MSVVHRPATLHRMNPRVRLGLLVLLAGCAGRMPGPVAPVGFAPDTGGAAPRWTAATVRSDARQLRFGWRFQDPKGIAEGRGSAQIAPLDSLRFDIRGPLGSGRSAAVVIGDSALWAEPEDQVKKLVPEYALLWAMLGQARAPGGLQDVSVIESAALQAWRYVQGADTVEFIVTRGEPRQLVADVRRAGSRVGRVVTTFAPDGFPRKARLDVPGTPARLDITFTDARALPRVPADAWERPTDAP